MCRHFLTLILFSIFTTFTYASFTLEDIFQEHLFNENPIEDIYFLNDGQHYSQVVIDEEKDINNILEYDIATGAIVDTILKGKNLMIDTTAIEFNSYHFSEDQQKILLTTNVQRIYRRSYTAKYYIWDRKKESLTALGDSTQQLATFSPDGSKVAFVSGNNLFVKDLVSGEITQITNDGLFNHIINGSTDWVYEEEFGFTKAFEWSLEGTQIAFYRFNETHVKEFHMPVYRNGNYPELYTFKYPKAGEQNAFVDIKIYNLKTQQISSVDFGSEKDQYIPRIKWTKNDNLLAIQRLNRTQNKLDILLYNSKENTTKTILTEEQSTFIDIHDNWVFTDNGFLWTSDQSGFNHLYYYDLNGELKQQLTNGEWDVTNVYGLESNTVYYQSAEASPLERHIYAISLTGENKKNLSAEPGMHYARFNDQFTYFIHYVSNTTLPPVISIKSINGEMVRVIENNEELNKLTKSKKLPQKDFFTFTTDEGVTLNGSMMKPKKFNKKKKYPVFMYVYGGPGSQTVTNDWASGHRDMWLSYLTTQGYIVVSVDNRGTGGRGSKFMKSTYGKLGELEVADQIAAAKYLGSLKYIDESRIGIFGWSYGGYMSTMSLLRGAEVFKMAIAVAPVTDWRFYDSIYTERYMNLPKNNAEGYDSSAHKNYIEELKGNYLLIHGSADDNVHYQNAAVLAKQLIDADKDFEFFTYPDKAHGISGGNTSYHLYKKMTNFVLENL